MGEIGHCNYCGRMILLECEKEDTTEERNKIATKHCDCKQAIRESEKEEEIKRAKERINQLFGGDSIKMGFDPITTQEIHDLMNGVVELISNKIIRGVTIQIDSKTKAKISISAKGIINIERGQTTKYKLEA